eukprot:1241923-Rhodomonas_salina.3
MAGLTSVGGKLYMLGGRTVRNPPSVPCNRYEMSGTDLALSPSACAARCPVLTWAVLLPGRADFKLE